MDNKDNVLVVLFVIFIAIVSLLAVHLKTGKIEKENQQKELIINLSENNIQKFSNLQTQIDLLQKIQENDKQILKSDIGNLYSKVNYLNIFTDSYDCLSIQNNESLHMICK